MRGNSPHREAEPSGRAVLGFGGGCHWCTEAVFQQLTGVLAVEQGHIWSQPPHHRPSEAVRVTFDPSRTDVLTLLRAHCHTHASTSDHALRTRYRSAVYYARAGQKPSLDKALSLLQPEFPLPLRVLVLPLTGLRRSPERYRNYYRRGPDRPFCRRYIQPKLARLEQL